MIINYIDFSLVSFLQSFQNRFLDILSLVLNWGTEGGIIWLFLCFCIFLFDKKEKERKIFLILLTLLLTDWVVNIPFKMVLLCRKRPFQTIEGIRVIGKVWENCSFPSGHLAVSTAAIFVIGYLFQLKTFWFYLFSFVFLFLLGLARIYSGMHYLSDVLGGVLLGIICASIIIYFDKQILWKKRN